MQPSTSGSFDSTVHALQICATTPGLCGPKTRHARHTVYQLSRFCSHRLWFSEAGKGGHESVGVGLSIRSLRVEGTAWLPPPPTSCSPSIRISPNGEPPQPDLSACHASGPPEDDKRAFCLQALSFLHWGDPSCLREEGSRQRGRAGSQGPRRLLG